MRIAFLPEPDGVVVARELVDGVPEGEFFLADTSEVHHRDPTGIVRFAGPNLDALRTMASAWDRYCSDVSVADGEEEELEVVARLKAEIDAAGGLRDGNGFWDCIVEQAKDGQL